MAERWRAPGGWTVEVVRLAATPDQHDGEWIRIRSFGFWYRDVATLAELAAVVPVDQLEPDGLGLFGRSYPARPGSDPTKTVCW